MLFEASPLPVEAHRVNILSWTQAPQEVRSEPVFVVEDLEGEEHRDDPSTHHIKVVDSDEDAGQLPPLFQPAPPASEEKVPPVSGSSDISWEDV